MTGRSCPDNRLSYHVIRGVKFQHDNAPRSPLAEAGDATTINFKEKVVGRLNELAALACA